MFTSLFTTLFIWSALTNCESIKVLKKDNNGPRLNDILSSPKCAVDQLIFPENYYTISELEGKRDFKIGGRIA
uniref:Uncharacterized protein n=1 Tax=Megaselia scalaris TaxID=36166 RepID=T1GAL1_MEGSC